MSTYCDPAQSVKKNPNYGLECWTDEGMSFGAMGNRTGSSEPLFIGTKG